MKRTPLLFALLFTACAVEDEVDFSTDESDLSKYDPTDPEETPTPTYTPPPPPPPPPANGPNVLRISTDEVASMMFLLGPALVVDTTKTSPPMYGPPRQIAVWPNQQTREQLYAECLADYSGSALFDCYREVDAEFPNYSELVWTRDVFHSYIDFPPKAEEYEAKDILLDVRPTYKDVYIGTVRLDINYLRTNGNTTAAIVSTSALDPEPSVAATFNFTSNYPTVICDESACPNVNLTNMKLALKLTSIGPGSTPGQLAFGAAQVGFTFSRNITGLPDWFITGLYDIDGKIRNAVETRLSATLQDQYGARPAIEAGLTKVALERAKLVHPEIQGFSRIRQTWFEASTGSIVIAYDWY